MKVNQQMRYSLSLFLVGICFYSWASLDQLEKKRYIDKSYDVNTSMALHVSNKFGTVEINSWDKSEFAINVEIVGRGRTEERAQRILDRIDININESSSIILFETSIEGMKNKDNEGFEVNYTISMPEINPLKIKNSFGDVYMGNRGGDLDINVAYGSMKVGDVSGNTDLRLSFGSGSINDVQEADMTVKYSSFDISSAQDLELEQGFSEVEIDEVQELELESKYGGVEIEKVHIVEADIQFSGFEIDELTGKLEMESSYIGDFRIRRLAKTFTLVDIDGKFGSYEIGLEPGLNANIDAEFSYADLKAYSDVDLNFHYRVKESNKSYYKGKIGDGDDTKLIRVDSSYGNLRLKED